MEFHESPDFAKFLWHITKLLAFCSWFVSGSSSSSNTGSNTNSDTSYNSDGTSSESDSSTTTVIGAVIGGILMILMMGFAFYVFRKSELKTKNKKHSENADTSTSMTFDFDVWLWPYLKIKTADVIRFRLLYCTLVSGMIPVSVIFCEIWTLVHFFVTFNFHLWPSSSVKVTFTLIILCILCC